MTIYVGGIRSRLISDSFFEMIRQSLTARHWFDGGQQFQPISIVRGDVLWSNSVQVNTLAVSDVDITDVDAEMGSDYSTDTWTMYVDFYAETKSLGLDVAGDVRDILRGKIPSIGRNQPILNVYDYTQVANVDTDTPPLLFSVEIETVVLDRAHDASQVQKYHWYSVRCNLIDLYGNENDS